MSDYFANPRAETSLYRFPSLFYPIAAIVALALQAYLPLLFHAAVYLDLPLLIVAYYGLCGRNAVGALLAGTGIGLLQDGVSHLALGLNGITDTVAGFIAAVVGSRLDSDNAAVRFLVVVCLYAMNASLIFLMERYLMARVEPWWGGRLALAAAFNGVVAIPVFRLLDRFRQRR
ncbi:MAG: rod shape-determining protein MreD [Terriglobales bacterium]